MIADVIAVVAIGGSLEHGRCVTVADPKVMQVGHDGLGIGELKSAVKLNPVCGRRDTHRIFFYQVGSLLASIVAIREMLKNPTTSVTVAVSFTPLVILYTPRDPKVYTSLILPTRFRSCCCLNHGLRIGTRIALAHGKIAVSK